MALVPKVCVVMSAYNAEAYLETQIESILAQEGVDVTLHVRDDGSSDRTVSMLEAYAAADNRVSVISGPNLKPLMGFMTALGSAMQFDCEFFSFSDADDYWMPDKLSAATRLLSRDCADRPKILCTAWTVADAELTPAYSVSTPEIDRGFRNALVECQAGGHTIVMNRPAAAVVARLDPAQAVMHDAWVYLVTCALGEVLYDPVPHSLYRQHGGNFDGAPEVKGLLFSIRQLFRRAKVVQAYQRQAVSLMSQIEDVIEPSRAEMARIFIQAGSGVWPAIRFAAAPRHYSKRRTQLISSLFLLLSRVIR